MTVVTDAKDYDVTDTNLNDYLQYDVLNHWTPEERRRFIANRSPDQREYLERAYRAWRHFGHWDYCDPIGDLIIDVVAAQNRLTRAFCESGYANPDPEVADIHAAKLARIRAIGALVEGLIEETQDEVKLSADLADVCQRLKQMCGD